MTSASTEFTTLDTGNLTVFNTDSLDASKIASKKTKKEAYLQELTLTSLQTLVNTLKSLPSESSEVGPVALLPKPQTALPRSKSIPRPKEATRWEQFARAKGIQKRKKSSHRYSEEQGEWRPTHGGRSAKNDPMNDWVEEL